MTENHEIHKFDTGKLKLKVTLAADRNAVDPWSRVMRNLVEKSHCESDKYDAIELALTRALANAVVQAPRPTRRKSWSAT